MNSLSMLDIGFYCSNCFAAELTASKCLLKLAALTQPPRVANIAIVIASARLIVRTMLFWPFETTTFVYFDGLNLISCYDGGTKSVS